MLTVRSEAEERLGSGCCCEECAHGTVGGGARWREADIKVEQSFAGMARGGGRGRVQQLWPATRPNRPCLE